MIRDKKQSEESVEKYIFFALFFAFGGSKSMNFQFILFFTL